MAKKEEKYFKSLAKMAKHAQEAAAYLAEVLGAFDVAALPDQIVEMHAIEHASDEVKHNMTMKLSKEFLPPIEREDIMEMAAAIDTVVDKTEDVLLRAYMFHVAAVRPGAVPLAKNIVKCANTLHKAVEEFPDFRKSKKLPDLLIEINDLEEEGDRLYQTAVRDLFGSGADAKETFAWYQIYSYMEAVSDSCEDAADVIESVMFKNS